VCSANSGPEQPVFSLVPPQVTTTAIPHIWIRGRRGAMSGLPRDVPRAADRPMKTNHENEAIVFDIISALAHRCRLCGRKFTAEMLTLDFTYGDHTLSEGHDGHPLLSITAAKARVERRSYLDAGD
jgi:hypothetical protein